MLIGCASRKVSKTNVQSAVEVEQVRETERDRNHQESSSGMTVLSQDETTVTLIEEFDTSLPVDPHTGTPPLKSRTTQTRDQKTDLVQEQHAEQASSECESDKTNSRVAASADVQVVSKTRRTTTWPFIVSIAGLGVLIIIFRKKLKTIFQLWQKN